MLAHGNKDVNIPGWVTGKRKCAKPVVTLSD